MNQPSSPAIVLRAGPLRARLIGADLWDVTVAGQPVLERIHGAVRDCAWLTVPGTVMRRRIDSRADGFTVQVRQRHCAQGIRLVSDLRFRGTADGALAVHYRVTADTGFLRQRIGLCLLHPPTAAGQPFTVIRADGSTREHRFPLAPEPWLVAGGITGMVLPLTDGRVSLAFIGDTFEMEDQRQWGDATCKTYSTPLDLPRPVLVLPGQRIVQEIRLRSATTNFAVTSPPPGPAPLPPPTTPVMPPRFGTNWAGRSPSVRERAVLARIGLAYLRVEVPLTGPWREDLATAAAAAADLGLGLELVVHAEAVGRESASDLARCVAGLPAPVEAVLVTDAHDRCGSPGAFALVATALPAARLGVGTRRGFTEINRGRPAVPSGGLLTWCITACEHADDDLSLLRNQAAWGLLVRTGQDLAPGAGIALGPLVLRRREGGPDRRWRGLFGATWLSRALIALASAERLCIADLNGPHGLAGDGNGLPVTAVLATTITATTSPWANHSSRPWAVTPERVCGGWCGRPNSSTSIR